MVLKRFRMLVDINHQRADRAVSAVGPDLVEAEAGLLPEFGRLRDALGE
jgi:hypothetical protein